MVDLKQYGGEGTGSYKGNKSDSSLPQHGGEGKNISKKSDSGLLKPDAKYRGPGANLGKK